jgi:hypothetical protein
MADCFLPKAAGKLSGEATFDNPSLCYQDPGWLTGHTDRDTTKGDTEAWLSDEADSGGNKSDKGGAQRVAMYSILSRHSSG